MPSRFKADPGKVEAFLRGFPLFADLDLEALRSLIKGSSVVGYELGETVFRAGEPGDASYVIVQGAIRVLSSEPGREISLTTLESGDHFGEVALVEGVPRTTTCRAAGDGQTLLIRIDASALAPVVATHPKLKDTCLRLGDFYRTWNFLKIQSVLGDVMSHEELRSFVPLLEARTFVRDEVVSREGDARSPLVIVRTGSVRIQKAGEPSPGVVGEGRYAGDEAVVRGVPGLAELRAASDSVEVLLAPRDVARKFLEQAPSVRDFLERNPCRPLDLASVKPLPRSFHLKDRDPSVYLGLEAMPAHPHPAERPATTPPGTRPPSSTHRAKPSRLFRVFRFPLVHQHDETDCGAASLAMVARYYGKKVGLGRLRELAGVSAEGASIPGLAAAAEALGFVARSVRVSGEALERHELPAIAHWGGSHFVVLYRIDRRHAWIADPAVGLRRLTRAELDAAFTGYLLLLDPTERFAEVREARSGLGRLLEQVRPYAPVLLEVALASLVLEVFGLASPLFTQAVVDYAIPRRDARLLWVLVLGMLTVAFFRIATRALRSYLLANLSMRLDLRMLLKFYFHVLSLPLGFFLPRKASEVLSRFAESSKVRAVLTGSVLPATLDVLMVGVSLALMLAYSWKLTLAVLLFLPLFLAVTLAFTPLLRRRSHQVFAARAEQEAHVVESVDAIETVKALGVERAVRWRWEELFARYLRSVYDAARVEIVLRALSEGLSTASSVVLLGYGAWLVVAEELTLGQLMAFHALVGTVMTPIGGLISLWDEVQDGSLALARLNDVFDTEPEESKGPSSLVDPRALLKGKVRLDRVFFRYAPDAPYVLEDVSLEIASGTTVAIVGRSGSGKSTLLRIILKLILPTEGHVAIDDLDLASISAQGLRRSVGFVPQDLHLVSGSIADNVALGADEVDRLRLEEVVRLAEAQSFVAALPQGLDTLVGERGLRLSGGQRQRIAIARALYHHPRLLLLDEATSSLDAEVEAQVLSNVRRASAGKTVVLVTQRLSAVRDADKILVLEKGRLVESGRHEDLLRERGLYASLFARQQVS